MNRFIILLGIILFFFSCSSIKQHKKDFYFSDISYNKDNILQSEFSYDSYSGILENRRPEKVIIKLNSNEKQEIYNLFKKLNMQSISGCKTYEDSITIKTTFIMGNEKNNSKCSTNKNEIDKLSQLYIKIKNILQTKKEYKDAFPRFYE
ncbi:hypothetical protein [Chryseobacterium rhizosphaerae]|uniref:hypothetical protein n=1 Tax=Chryseobacterium rhizosphaerae TaxID=395937 RepID=UPI0023580F7E|nr:hypothetical protein [Chryseobacterium rhizosphaerae]MDC8101640.1 hypothetical protein [Chryseobacterium rhizosphaerae]